MTPLHIGAGQAVARHVGGQLLAHRLVSVRRPDQAELNDAGRDAVAILTALEGHRDCTFTIQWTCDPRVGDPRGGDISICLVTAVDQAANPERVAEVADDIADLMSGPPGLWLFRPVLDPEELRLVLNPVDPVYAAEITRREEEIPNQPATAAVGFADAGHRRTANDAANQGPFDGLWTMWTLGPPTPDTDRLAATLLAQEAPVSIRMTLAPTQLDPVERESLEDLVHRTMPLQKEPLFYRAAHQTLDALLYLRPLFRARCVVASTAPLSLSLLSVIGHTLSEPAKHVDAPPPALAGGYEVVQIPPAHAGPAFTLPGASDEISSLAPPPLRRLRSLFGVWEAANLFRLPVLGDHDVQGLAVDKAPRLPGVLSYLPSDGTKIGSIPWLADRSVTITPTDRFRHAYVVGQTGTGKSTLLQTMALCDIDAGHGVWVIDPHGDLVEGILARIPEHRMDDVVLIDPGDPEAVTGVNLIEAESDVQQNYLVAELSNMFYALFDPGRTGIVGPRFETMLRQTVLLLQSGDVPASFLDVPTVFTDRAVREHLTGLIRDPILAEYWLGEVVQNRSNEWGEVVSWFRSKFEVFRTSSLLRRVVGQAQSSVSFTDALRTQQIVLINLSKGALGEYNSALLGHVVVMKLWGAILERALTAASDRPECFVYIDEFQNFTTDSLDTMLAEARKYGVGLTLANQFFEQLSGKTRAALLGNVGSKLAFRLGPPDAQSFATWVAGDVDADELVHLPNHQLVAALSPDGTPTGPVLLRTEPPGDPDLDRARAVRNGSRHRHARPVAAIDTAFTERWAAVPGSIAANLLHHSPNPFAEPPKPPPAPSHQRFLDEWLQLRQPPRLRRWTWIDDWIDARLEEQASDEPIVFRATISNPQAIDWEHICDRLHLDAKTVAEQLGREPGFITLDRSTAGRVALELRARDQPVEWFTRHALASKRTPDDVFIRAVGLPQPVELELMLADIYTVGEVREAPRELLDSLDVPAALLADVHALRGDLDDSTWVQGFDEHASSPANLRNALGVDALASLADALAARVATFSTSSHHVMHFADQAEADAPSEATSAGRLQADESVDWWDDVASRHHRAELTFQVVQRLPDIIQLLGEA